MYLFFLEEEQSCNDNDKPEVAAVFYAKIPCVYKKKGNHLIFINIRCVLQCKRFKAHRNTERTVTVTS